MKAEYQGREISEWVLIAENIASETFIKNGNKFIPFTENKDLRLAIGGRYQSDKELTQIVARAYNDKLTDLICFNL